MVRKLLLIALSSFALIAAAVPTIAQAAPDEQWIAPRSGGETERMLEFNWGEGLMSAYQKPAIEPGFPPGKSVPGLRCSSVDDPRCQEAISLIYSTYFDTCRTSSDTDCIEEFWVTNDAGKRFKGKFKQNFPASTKDLYSNAGSRYLLKAANPSLFSVPGISGSAETNFIVAVGTYSVTSTRKQGPPPKNFNPIQFYSAQIYTVDELDFKTLYSEEEIRTKLDREKKRCAAFDDVTKVCQLKMPFPENLKLGLKLRFAGTPLGWLHGRIKSPVAEVKYLGNVTTIAIEGLPLQVPIQSTAVPYKNLRNLGNGSDDTYIQTFHNYSGGMNESFGTFNSLAVYPGLSGNTEGFENWRKFAGDAADKAAATPAIWKFGSMPSGPNQIIQNCVSEISGFAGMVSTNALTYMTGPPDFDPSTGNLDYVVSSPHFAPNNQPFEGTYDLLMDSRVAKCIYDFAKVPTSASISVLKDGNVEKTSTTTVQEKNGFLLMSAQGFNFSSPTLRVKLIAPKSTKAITCKKGSVTKKVKGVSPKCPKGFKQVK